MGAQGGEVEVAVARGESIEASAALGPVQVEAAEVALAPFHQRCGGLNQGLVEEGVIAGGSQPALFPLLVGMPVMAGVEEADSLKILGGHEYKIQNAASAAFCIWHVELILMRRYEEAEV